MIQVNECRKLYASSSILWMVCSIEEERYQGINRVSKEEQNSFSLWLVIFIKPFSRLPFINAVESFSESSVMDQLVLINCCLWINSIETLVSNVIPVTRSFFLCKPPRKCTNTCTKDTMSVATKFSSSHIRIISLCMSLLNCCPNFLLHCEKYCKITNRQQQQNSKIKVGTTSKTLNKLFHQYTSKGCDCMLFVTILDPIKVEKYSPPPRSFLPFSLNLGLHIFKCTWDILDVIHQRAVKQFLPLFI